MEDLIYGCGGSISDRCNEYIENNLLPPSIGGRLMICYKCKLSDKYCKCSNIKYDDKTNEASE